MAEPHSDASVTNGAARKPRRQPRPAAKPVTVQRVDPALLREARAVALELAHGDKARLHVVNATTVIVVNQPGLGIPARRRNAARR